ncbi:hypothetical protein ACP275_09G118600 [Erythranthe tilingii]
MFAAVIAAGGESRMIVCRSLFRINLLSRERANTCVNSKPLVYFQKCNFSSGLSCKSKMEAEKGRKINFDRNKRNNVTQTWRAVSTQPNIVECESSNREPVGPAIEVSTNDGKLVPPNNHSVAVEIGSSLVHFIKGKGRGAREEIERETGVKLIFPSSKQGDSIIIEGNSAESVTKASEKIQIVVDKAVNSRELDYSHFVSLPLAVHPGLLDKLVDFQNTILGITAVDKEKNPDSDSSGETSDKEVKDQQSEKADARNKINTTSDQNSEKAPLVAVELKAEDAGTSRKFYKTDIPLVRYSPKKSIATVSETISSKLKDLGIDKSIFIKPKTFHLTVLMLKLWNKDRVKTAAEVLQNVSPKVMDALENRPLSIRLKGLDRMRGSMAKASVIYAPVEEIGDEGRLLRACEVITDAFVEAGLVVEKDIGQKLKLHATLMNARHRKRKDRTRKFESFDARGIFDMYGSEDWGVYPIYEAHLSQRFVFDDNGYYHCCASIPFPKQHATAD